MSYQTILLEQRDAVGWITLNRPKALNALNNQLMTELADALTVCEDNDEIGAMVITGSEKAFAAGADIKEMQASNSMDMYMDDRFGVWNRVTHCRKPVVAAVAGYALGGGCELAMMCDIILAADNAKFGQPEINIGILPGAGGTQRLTRYIGKPKAMELCLTGRMMDADEAERSGLVSRIVALADLLSEAEQVASTIAQKSRAASFMTKEAVNRAYETTLAEGLHFERRMFYAAFSTEDQKEGMAAFADKRTPEWKNR